MFEKLFRSNTIRWLLHCALCALYMVVFCTSANYVSAPLDSFGDVAYVVLAMGLVFVACWCGCLFLSLLPAAAFVAVHGVVVFLSAVLTYYGFTMNFQLSVMMLDIVFDTDLTICADMVTWRLVVWTLLVTAGGIALSLLRTKYRIEWREKWFRISLAALVGISAVMCSTERLRMPPALKIPYVMLYRGYDYLNDWNWVRTERPRCFTEASCAETDLTCVVVVGESLRSANLGLNGYWRNTTPHLAELGAVSFDRVFTEYEYTNRSVPHMLTRADSLHPERAYSERSFLDVFNALGFNTVYLANQNPETAYIYFFNEAKTRVRVNEDRPLYSDAWLDIDLVPELENVLDSVRGNSLILLHMIGSHWWYNTHYTKDFERFVPALTSRDINSDSIAKVNSYDNTVLYTDHVLSQVIGRIKDRKSILVFMSDHAESLGENGIWMHGTEGGEPVHHPAAFVWVSESYKTAYPEKMERAEANRHNFYRSDVFFHSVLDAANVQTDILDTTLSVFRARPAKN